MVTYVEEGADAREVRGGDVELGGELPLVRGRLVLEGVLGSDVPALSVEGLASNLKSELVVCEGVGHLPSVHVAGDGAVALLGVLSLPCLGLLLALSSSLCLYTSIRVTMPSRG